MDEKKLQEYFDFDETDLTANRKGRLTEKQKNRFKPPTTSNGREIGCMGFVFLAIAAMGLFGAVSFFINETDWVGRIAFGLAFGVIWPLVWGGIGVSMLKSFRGRRPSTGPRVKAERGPLKLVKHEAQDSIPYYELRVGEISVETDHDFADILKAGEKFTLYYIQTTKQVVSLERVKKSD